MTEDTAIALTSIVLFLTVGGVILLRPIAKRLGMYLEVLVDEKRARIREPADSVPRTAFDGLEQRLSVVEERLEFTERLLAAPRVPQTKPGPSVMPDPGDTPRGAADRARADDTRADSGGQPLVTGA